MSSRRRFSERQGYARTDVAEITVRQDAPKYVEQIRLPTGFSDHSMRATFITRP